MNRNPCHVAAVSILAVLTMSGLPARARAQQVADSSFHPVVARPAFTTHHPRIVLDEAHHNFHTASGRYSPFVRLMEADGFRVTSNTRPFTHKKPLKGASVLVIANALAPGMDADSVSRPAFSVKECQTIERWVKGGGALLLIADHAPFGSAAEILSLEFGVNMSKGYTVDSLHTDLESRSPSVLVYTRENGTLMDHPITLGRDSTERVYRVMTFTGQSLSVPPGATPFLRLADSAEDLAMTMEQWHGQAGAIPPGTPAKGRAQGVALSHGKGRVLILGEAAMLSAQILTFQDPSGKSLEATVRMGMNRPGIDNQQLALNLMHWLVGAIK